MNQQGIGLTNNDDGKLYRSVRYARLGGVCSGIALARGYSILLTRIFALFIMSTAGIGLFAYLLG